MRSETGQCLLWGIIAGLVMLVSSLEAAPRPADVHVLPTAARPAGAPPATTNGLTVKVDTTVPSGLGYMPVPVTVSVATPAPVDRTISVTIDGNRWPQHGIRVSADLELRAGQTTVSETLYVPSIDGHSWGVIEISDDGVPLPDLGGHVDFNRRRYRDYKPSSGQSFPGNLLICASKGESYDVNTLWNQSNALVVERVDKKYAPYDLPDTALALQHWNVIAMSLDELQFLHEERRPTFTALRQWVLSGGVLWIYGVGANYERIAEIDEVLDPDTPKSPSTIPGLSQTAVIWRGMTRDEINSRIDDATNYLLYVPPNASGAPNPSADEKKERKRLSVLKSTLQARTKVQSPFLWARWGLGRLVALNTPSLATEEEDLVRWILLADSEYDWEDRHAAAFGLDNTNFWNFRIAGVGNAPVTAFEILITLFVVVIGPVNYVWLRKRHQETLLIFTVPLFAGLVTCGLLLYALVSDGLGVRARSRCYTLINQRLGEAACWSRLAFYAGMRPAAGLTYSNDIAVYPIFDEESDTNSATQRKIAQGSVRRFTRGWLPSRVLTQYLTVRARSTSAALVVESAGDSAPRVVNRLGTSIQELFLVDETGKLWWGEPTESGATVSLSTISSAEAARRLGAIHDINNLTFPPDWHSTTGQSRRLSRGYYNGSRTNTRIAPGYLMEESLNGIGVAGHKLPARSYIAIVDQSPEFELGLAAVSAHETHHVIVGQW